MANKSKPSTGPQDGNFERYIEELVKQQPHATQSNHFDQATMFPEQAQLTSTPISSASGTTSAGVTSSAVPISQTAPQEKPAEPSAKKQNQQPKVYVFDFKKNIFNVLCIWVILGAMNYVIMPPEKHALMFCLIFFLGLGILVLNFQRHNKPLPTRQENINRAGQAVLKRIILFFLKE